MQDDRNGAQPSWSYLPDTDQSLLDSGANDVVSWTASEFISHDKGTGWYIIFGIVTAFVTFIAFMMTREVITVVVIIIVAITFGAFANRKPRTLPYRIDNNGVHIESKTFGYENFKSFTLLQEDGIRSLSLQPTKRFMPQLSLYFDPAEEDSIVSALSLHLPYEDREQDLIDRLMRHLRF